MNILLFGGTGKVGRIFVKQAPQEFRLTVFSRKTNGDIFSGDELRKLLQGQDAVLSLLGHRKDSPPDLQTRFMKLLIPLMKERGVKRLVSLTGSGVPDIGNDAKKGFWRFFNEMSTKAVGLLASERLQDGIEHARVIMESDLDWTILRTPLQLGARSNGSYWAGYVGKTGGWFVKREDIAHFITKILQENSYIRQLPYLVS